MRDLIRVLELNKINKIDQRMSKGSESLFASRGTFDSVPHHDVCRNCKVVGGCDDLNPLCDLSMVHHIRSTGEQIDRLLETPKWIKRREERERVLSGDA